MNLNHDAQLQTLRDALQQRLDHLLPAGAQQDQIYSAMREGTLVAGKRVRPLLLMLAAHDLAAMLTSVGCSISPVPSKWCTPPR